VSEPRTECGNCGRTYAECRLSSARKSCCAHCSHERETAPTDPNDNDDYRRGYQQGRQDAAAVGWVAATPDPTDPPETWRDAGIRDDIANGRPLNSFQRARLIEMVDGSATPEPTDLRTDPDIRRRHRVSDGTHAWCETCALLAIIDAHRCTVDEAALATDVEAAFDAAVLSGELDDEPAGTVRRIRAAIAVRLRDES
jgi:hypothetical protein